MLLPELHLEGARRALDELATGLSDRLTEIASGVAAGRHEQGPAWLTAAREFDGPLPDARVALEQSTEASRWNVRARPYRAELATLTSRLAILDQVAVQLRGIARTLADHPEASALWANPDLAARLAAVACAVRGMPPEAEAAGELTASRGVPRPKQGPSRRLTHRSMRPRLRRLRSRAPARRFWSTSTASSPRPADRLICPAWWASSPLAAPEERASTGSGDRRRSLVRRSIRRPMLHSTMPSANHGS